MEETDGSTTSPKFMQTPVIVVGIVNRKLKLRINQYIQYRETFYALNPAVKRKQITVSSHPVSHLEGNKKHFYI